MKQARAFGVGVVAATQNPVDLDYRALSNDLKDLNQTIGRLAPRWFVVRNAHVPEAGNVLLNPRHTMSILRGPLTRVELKRAREGRGLSSRPLPIPTPTPIPSVGALHQERLF